MENTKKSSEEILEIISTALEDKMGDDIRILDLNGISSLTDYFVIVSGNNKRQAMTMAEEVEKKLKEVGVLLYHSEGQQAAEWIVLDFGNVIIHIFDSETREFYNLERTWGDAKIMELRGNKA